VFQRRCQARTEVGLQRNYKQNTNGRVAEDVDYLERSGAELFSYNFMKETLEKIRAHNLSSVS
jgi:hypothetical protein